MMRADAPLTMEEWFLKGCVATCGVCGRRTQGSWRIRDGARIRTPRRHRAGDGAVCPGSDLPAIFAG